MLPQTNRWLPTLLLITASTSAQLNNITTPALNITALDGVNGTSVLQCWQLDPFSISTTPGTVGALSLNLGNVSSATYQIIPGRTDAGLHHAAAPQLVYYTSGLIRLSLPNTTQEAWIVGGKYGLIFAQDTTATSQHGHLTEYVSDEDTVVVVIPLATGQSLRHEVLHEGGCTWAEMTGL